MIIKGRYKTTKEDKFDRWVTYDNVKNYHADYRIEKPKTEEEYLENQISFDLKDGTTIVWSVYHFDELYVMNDDGRTFETLRCIDPRIIKKLT